MTLQELETRLGSPDPEERRRAAARLIEYTPDDAASLVLRALGDDDWRVRKEAAAAAVTMPPGAELLKALVGAFGAGDNVGLRNAAVEALAGHGAAAVEPVAAALETLDADGRKLAAEALGKTGSAAAVRVLRGLLTDPDLNVRGAAVEGIAALGTVNLDAAMPVLEGCLDSPDRFVRLAALDGLNQLGVVLRWERLVPMLKDPILERAALLAIGRSAHEKAAPALAEALSHAHGSLWMAALLALVDFVRASPRMLVAAQSALARLDARARERLLDNARQSDDVALRRQALVVSGALGSADAAEVAVDALSDDAVAGEAEEALAMLGPIAITTLVERSRSGSPEQRSMCVDLLGRLTAAADSEATIPALLSALEDRSLDLVHAALDALATVGDERCLPAVAAWLTADHSDTLRKSAATALARIAQRHPNAARELSRAARPDQPDALAAAAIVSALGAPVRGSLADDVAFLSAALASTSGLVRKGALDALAALGSALGVEAVAFALTDEEREVQLAAVRALGRLRAADGSAAGIEQLLALVGRADEDEALAAAAIRALGEAGDTRALGVLRPMARGGAPIVAVAAVEAIGRLADPRRVDSLTAALGHRDGEVVKAAMRVLSGERDPRGVAHLGACLDHEAWDVRRLAAELLGRAGGDTATELLRAKLASEVEPLVKDALARALVDAEGGGAVRRTAPPPRPGSPIPR